MSFLNAYIFYFIKARCSKKNDYIRWPETGMVCNAYNVLPIFENLIQGLIDKGFESVDYWFDEAELDGLRKTLMALYEKNSFHTAGIGNKEILQTEKNIRNDHVFWLEKPTANEYELFFWERIDNFVQYLNQTCFAGIVDYEFHFAVYEPGSFYKKHVDRFKNDNRRAYTFICYLTENWQPGNGGELVLYTADKPLIVEPLGGRVLFFTSDLPHEVLKTNIRRLSLTGWLKTR